MIKIKQSNEVNMREKIEELLEKEIRPALASHGGGVELVDVDNNKVYVRLQGGCKGCA
ncbi:MAG: NifU family protein, partial [Bacteriovoracaceae bacterium]|nr:NifU family protein [Bacteriovoracaceae bacterium]